ncbi:MULTISPECIES: methionine/alanine import family NSS transporter small subunit [unclassified Luteococcus]
MTPIALVMLVLSLALVWGGLVAAIINLRRHPSPYED